MNKMKAFVIIGVLVILFFVVGLGVSIYTSCNGKAELDKVEQIEPFKCEGDDAIVPETEPEQVEETTKDEVKEWVDKFFSPEKVAMYISWVAYIGTIIGLVANIKRLKQSNNLTLKDVSAEVKNVLKETVGEEVAKQFEGVIPALIDGQGNMNRIMTIFAKILALSQENSPTSRIAILDLVEELGVVGKELVDNAKTVVEEGEKAIEEHKKELDDKCDEIIEKYDGTSI